MARLQLLVMTSLWLGVVAVVVRAWVRQRPHRHWVAGLETMRAWGEARRP
jgi:hypothetical protein